MDSTVSAQLDNAETIRYADDIAETYETQITRRTYKLMGDQEIKSIDGR